MLKYDILSDLSGGKTVSGQELAIKYNVSRSAVWKAVNALKAEGYLIIGANKAGYTLKETDALTPHQLGSDAEKYCAEHAINAVNARFRALNIVCLPTVGSTNDEAKRLAVSEGKNALVVAAEQTAGRGRLGRSFYSPDKTGAYFSLALCGERDFAEAVKFTSLAAVAVCRAIENLTDKSPAIKWVNDVYVGEKKVCGILTEAASDMESGKTSFVVTGVGINLTTENFPADVACAGALGEKNLTRSRIISATVCEILKEVPYITQNRHISYYRERSFLTGKEIKYYLSGKEFYGVAENIDDNGALIVRTSDGTLHTLTGGEVTVRLKG